MSRITPLPVAQLSETARANLVYAQQLMGFIPNDVLTMAHRRNY